jgi:sialate O-acetylesterase
MVLQREQPVPVWGTADPSAAVTVKFAGQTKTATADADGKWKVMLDSMATSSEPRKLTVSSSLDHQQSAINDVLVGEVWFCSGQSNMQMPMQGLLPQASLDNLAAEIATANYPEIRLYDTPRVFSTTPKETIDAHWNICTPKTVKPFSACAYFFGRKLHRDLHVPVGLLLSCWGGTRIEPWTPSCGFEGIESLHNIYQLTKNPIRLSEKASLQTPTVLYNGMLSAHIPFAIKGAIWYQGESNHDEGMLYVDKTQALLSGWHKLWGYDFPFYFVQIAPFQYGDNSLPEFWEAQSEIAKTIPETGMAVINDVATLDNIHPPNKKDPGERLALLAEAHTYGMNVVSSGPIFQTLEIYDAGGVKQDNALKVVFDSAKGLTTRDGKAPDWFEIAGKDGGFKPATAEIKGDHVILSSPDVTTPQAMRFAWSKLATPNLVNGAGLPCSAFRASLAK